MSAAYGLAKSLDDAIAALRSGDRRTLSRFLSSLEDDDELSGEVMAQVRGQRSDKAVPVLALTGPPGVGKSTLAAALVGEAVEDGYTVAVLAVDPSSPTTGGALLGDRIRMTSQVKEGVFIRSFANRGVVGGLARVVPEAVDLVSAAGYDLVLIETVGVGQSEIDVAAYADVTVLVVAPNLGDQVQAAKAGLIEIADVVIVNKCDLPGADRTLRDLKAMIKLRQGALREMPVLKVTASTGEDVSSAWKFLSDRLATAVGRASPELRAVRARIDKLVLTTAEAVRRSCLDAALPESSIAGRALGGQITAGEAAQIVVQLLTKGAGTTGAQQTARGHLEGE